MTKLSKLVVGILKLAYNTNNDYHTKDRITFTNQLSNHKIASFDVNNSFEN